MALKCIWNEISGPPLMAPLFCDMTESGNNLNFTTYCLKALASARNFVIDPA